MTDKNEKMESDNQKARIFVNQLGKKSSALEKQYNKLSKICEKHGINPEEIKQEQILELQAKDNFD